VIGKQKRCMRSQGSAAQMTRERRFLSAQFSRPCAPCELHPCRRVRARTSYCGLSQENSHTGEQCSRGVVNVVTHGDRSRLRAHLTCTHAIEARFVKRSLRAVEFHVRHCRRPPASNLWHDGGLKPIHAVTLRKITRRALVASDGIALAAGGHARVPRLAVTSVPDTVHHGIEEERVGTPRRERAPFRPRRRLAARRFQVSRPNCRLELLRHLADCPLAQSAITQICLGACCPTSFSHRKSVCRTPT